MAPDHAPFAWPPVAVAQASHERWNNGIAGCPTYRQVSVTTCSSTGITTLARAKCTSSASLTRMGQPCQRGATYSRIRPVPGRYGSAAVNACRLFRTGAHDSCLLAASSRIRVDRKCSPPPPRQPSTTTTIILSMQAATLDAGARTGSAPPRNRGRVETPPHLAHPRRRFLGRFRPRTRIPL